jgi:hypothetical protein
MRVLLFQNRGFSGLVKGLGMKNAFVYICASAAQRKPHFTFKKRRGDQMFEFTPLTVGIGVVVMVVIFAIFTVMIRKELKE